MEKYFLSLYKIEKKVEFSMLEELKLEKFIRLQESIQGKFPFNMAGLHVQNTPFLEWYKANNYDTHYTINTIIGEYIDELYSDLVENKNNDSFYDKKEYFMHIIKLETTRLNLLKKNYKKLGDTMVNPQYISNLAKIYNLDDEKVYSMVFFNVHTELGLKAFQNSTGFGADTDLEQELDTILSRYSVSDNVKTQVKEAYDLHEKESVPDNKDQKVKKIKFKKD